MQPTPSPAPPRKAACGAALAFPARQTGPEGRRDPQAVGAPAVPALPFPEEGRAGGVADGLPGDAFDPACPTRQVLDRIGDKWATLILLSLAEGPLRFNALQRRVRGISQKVLSHVLKGLERDGFVTRTAFPTVPVTVEYALTPLSHGLIGILGTITRWAEAHVGQIDAARRAHDARRQGG